MWRGWLYAISRQSISGPAAKRLLGVRGTASISGRKPSLQRVENDKFILQLRSDLNTAISQLLTAASNQLMVTQAQVSPGYQCLESERRNRINNELLQQQESRTEYGAQFALIKQLSALEPIELGSLISL